MICACASSMIVPAKQFQCGQTSQKPVVLAGDV
ncbi:hypothetical protein AT5A_19496 [Agrobacterium tumefaciens 5A]|nr:hypothetical protein AT5A_19496 [Agrobacterium tumefaciens 5A]